jgi:hypothetical protein
VILAIDIAIGIPRRPDMGQITLVYGIPLLLELFHHCGPIDRIPDDDGIALACAGLENLV